MKRNHLPLKEFINQLKSTLKGKYNAAVWPIAGITLSDEDIMNLEMATGQPVVYDFDEKLNVLSKEKY